MATVSISSKILATVKDSIGGDITDSAFDQELIVHINTVLSILNQMGIGVSNFEVTGNETWADFLTTNTTPSGEQKFQIVKTFVCLKVRQIFDPAASSVVASSIESSLKELEWRLYSLANY